MTDEKLKGFYGEQLAARHLRDNGYEILCANYTTQSGEIDIIAENESHVCFVEVKTRKPDTMLPPSSAVDYKKQRRLRNTAAAFIATAKIKKQVRFDIIEIILTDYNNYKIEHIEDAFQVEGFNEGF